MNKKLAAVAAGVLAASLTAATAAASHTEVVSGSTTDTYNDPGGWLINVIPDFAVTAEFNSDVSTVGTGALFVEPITNVATSSFAGPQKLIAELFLQTDVATVTPLAVDYQLAGAPDASEVYFNVYVNLPGTPLTNFYDCRFDYTASAGSDTAGIWQTLTVLDSTAPDNVRPRGGATCPATLDGLASGSTVRSIVLNFGDTSANDEGEGVYYDNVIVGSHSYDFEPPLAPLADKDECKNGGFALYGFANQGACVSSLQANDKAGK